MEAFVGFTAKAVTLEDVEYPPCCSVGHGPLRFRPVRDGGALVEVDACQVEKPVSFRLDLLFSNGSCLFYDAADLALFWNDTLACAFGLPKGPLPDRRQGLLFDRGAAPPSQQDRAPTEPKRKRGDGSRIPARTENSAKVKVGARADVVARRLATEVRGQELALQWLADSVVSQLAKRSPRRPATALLIGPTGVGKTMTVDALPGALEAHGWPSLHIHRIDCNELKDDYDVHRFLGASPGLVGYTDSPPLVAALRKGPCVVMLDEIDKAHPAVQESLYALLDSGRVMTPDGKAVSAPGAIVVMTSTDGADELRSRLHQVPPANRSLVDRTVREHLRERHWPDELVGRIDTICVYRSLRGKARRRAAAQAIHVLAAEYGFSVVSIPPVLVDVVVDLAIDEDSGTRALYYGARRLLGAAFTQAALENLTPAVSLDAGPPPAVIPAAAPAARAASS